MKKGVFLAVALWCAAVPAPFAGAGTADLFRDPPESARPHVFWYWIQGHISREGITADLEAMKEAGIGGAMIFNIGGHGPEGPVLPLTPEWRGLMRHALTEGRRLGLEMSLNNSMTGWSSSGGPWITPELAMQKVVWTETRVTGPSAVPVRVPAPKANLGFYRDIAVIAFPTPAAETVLLPEAGVTSSDPKAKLDQLSDGNEETHVTLSADGSNEVWIRREYAGPVVFRSVKVKPGPGGAVGEIRVLAGDAGEGVALREVAKFTPRQNAPANVAFDAPAARVWELRFAVKVQSVAGEPVTRPVRLAEAVLSPGYRLTEWTGKAMFDPYGLDKPEFADPPLELSGDCVIPPESILDLTDKLSPAGALEWRFPAGDWTILRFGYTPTGSPSAPEFPSIKTLECDKLDPAALEVHWKHSLQPWFDDPETNAMVGRVHIDSYERGAQNWTAAFPGEFAARRGYDLRGFLPALTGRIIGDVRMTERFLWDFRNAVVGLMTDHYFGRMGELCAAAGKGLSIEPYHQTQFNNVAAGGKATVPMCELWVGEGVPSPYWAKLGSSPAHVYGRTLVAAEAFTAPGRYGGNWSTDFYALKPTAESMFVGGVNLMHLHVYVHQPRMDLRPGWTLGPFGTHFERTNTWWPMMPGFTGYLRRCQAVLQTGQVVADILYSCGENSPDDGYAPKGAIAPPRGYDYDVADPAVIHRRLSVRDGRIWLPEGKSYALLVLPEVKEMTPEMARRIGELVEAGATVVGPRPEFAPGLKGQPAADGELRSLTAKIWGDIDGTEVKEHALGKGRVVWGRPLAEILKAAGVAPDFDAAGNKSLRYIHKRVPDGDLYFVSSSSQKGERAEVLLRVNRPGALLMDPVTGVVRPLAGARDAGGRVQVPLVFEPLQSWFLFFPDIPSAEPASGVDFPEWASLRELSGPWEVAFDPERGGPERAVFESLADWAKEADPGIRYYSGIATYRRALELSAAELRGPLFLDLGTVKNVARVRLNGREAGVVWCPPWRVEIGGLAHAGENRLEIEVANLWPNRLIGDEQLPPDCEYAEGGWPVLKTLPAWYDGKTPRSGGRTTFTGFKHWSKNSPLLPSGLLGPVTLQKSRRADSGSGVRSQESE
jgi:hypothetical protein